MTPRTACTHQTRRKSAVGRAGMLFTSGNLLIQSFLAAILKNLLSSSLTFFHITLQQGKIQKGPEYFKLITILNAASELLSKAILVLSCTRFRGIFLK